MCEYYYRDSCVFKYRHPVQLIIVGFIWLFKVIVKRFIVNFWSDYLWEIKYFRIIHNGTICFFFLFINRCLRNIISNNCNFKIKEDGRGNTHLIKFGLLIYRGIKNRQIRKCFSKIGVLNFYWSKKPSKLCKIIAH